MAGGGGVDWPELIDRGLSRLPEEAYWRGWYALIGVAVIAALAYVRRMLAVPAVPTAAQIVDEMVARGKVPLVQAPVDVEAAVHRAINGSAERIKRVEALSERLAVEMGELRHDTDELRKETSELKRETVELRKETGTRHADNQREFGQIRGVLGMRRGGR